MQYEKDGSLLILGTPRRILTVTDTHVFVEGGKTLSVRQAEMYPYSPPATSKRMMLDCPRLPGKKTMLQEIKQERLM
jgi:hypothetical protein